MEGIQTTVKFAGPGDSVAVIKVGGYIDTTTSSELERTLGSLLKKNQHRIVVDLGDVDYISSAGWGIFISEIKGIKENSGDLKLVRMIPDDRPIGRRPAPPVLRSLRSPWRPA